MVTVKYVDIADGHTVKRTQNLFGYIGQDLNLSAPVIDSMNYVGVEGNPNGKYTTDSQTITFEYNRIPMNITISSFDEAGNLLGADDNLQFTGQNYDLFHGNMLDRAGWTIDLDKSLYSELGQSVTLRQMMEMSNSTTADEMANFMNEKLRTDTVIDEDHDYIQADVTIKVVYKQVLKTEGMVNVHYVDVSGNSISDDQQLSGLIGSQYTVSPKVIKGYSIKGVNSDVSGSFTDEDQAVTFIYQKDIVASDPNQSSAGSTNGETKHDVTTPTQLVNGINNQAYKAAGLHVNEKTLVNVSASEGVLPNTGTNPGVTITLAGLAMLVTSLIIVLKSEEY